MKRCVGLFAAAVCLAVTLFARDWKQCPALIQIDGADEIFAIGDAHSDFIRLEHAMAGAGIIEKTVADPAEPRWNAGRAVLVTTGDMIDKGLVRSMSCGC